MVFEVEDGAALGVVEGGGAVEGAEDEGEEYCAGYCLQTESPSDGTRKREILVRNFGCVSEVRGPKNVPMTQKKTFLIDSLTSKNSSPPIDTPDNVT